MVSTIFFDGFGPWGTDHIGEIDPVYWDVSSGVSLSKYRDERVSPSFSTTKEAVKNFYGEYNGIDFMGHTYGAVTKLNSHWSGSQNYLKIKGADGTNPGFPGSITWTDPTKSATSTAFGIGFFINKITTDAKDAPGATANFSSKFVDLTNKALSILELDAVHLGTVGYNSVPTSEQKVGIRVRQKTNGNYHSNDTQLFTFDVWGAPWYLEQNTNAVGTNFQRMIDAYDYKYGGLYVEICAMEESAPTAANRPYSLQIKVNGMNLGVEGLPEEKKLYIKDTWNSYAVTKNSLSIANSGLNYIVGNRFAVTDPNGGSGATLTVTKVYESYAITKNSLSVSNSGLSYLVGNRFAVTDPSGGAGAVLEVTKVYESYAVSEASFQLDSPGTGYNINDTFNVSDSVAGSGAVLTVSATGENGAISNWSILPSGSGFTTAPIAIADVAVTGTGASFTGNINNFFKLTTANDGKIMDFRISPSGSGFTTTPVVSPIAVSGTGAVFAGNINNFFKLTTPHDGKIIDFRISPSGSGFTEAPTVSPVAVSGTGAVFTGNVNNFSKLSTNPNGLVSKYFDSLSFYGSRTPKDPAGQNPDPITYYYVNNIGQAINQNYMYDTYIDNIYVIGGVNDQDCFLGPTTKVFNISPSGGNVLNSNDSWQAFNLTWNSTTDIEQNLRDSNGDRSYVFTETSGAILALNMGDIPSDPNYAVGGIKITNSVRKSNKDTSFMNVWGTGTNPVSMSGIGINFPVTDNHYQYKNQYFITNPVTGSGWSFADINNGRFGIKKTT